MRGRLEEQLSRFSRIGNACFSDCHTHPRRLNGDVHTKQELRMRSVEGEGGLCALAAYYQALYHTFLSRFVVMPMTLMTPIEEPTNQLTDRLTDRPTNQPTYQLTYQPTNIHKVTFQVPIERGDLSKYEKSPLGVDRRGRK